MCGRYCVVESIEAIEKRFNAEARAVQLEINYNISVGQKAPVITSEDPKKVQLFQFGLTPSWAKKQMYLFNARSEGDHNKEDDPTYRGAKGIILKPAYRKPIRSQRCLVIATAFYEGPKKEGLSKPYLIYLKNKKRPFAFAGIYDTWENPEGGKINSFSIITTTANELLQKIGHHRMPVILHQEEELVWLGSETHLSKITQMLEPYSTELMNAYPISPEIKNPKNNTRELLNPTGERVYPEFDYKTTTKLVEKGWGHRKKNSDDSSTWGERGRGESNDD
jgi:putative SOS response-associated peptidase YedK